MNTIQATPAVRVPFAELLELASEKVGGRVIATNDDFFAPKENLIKATVPVFVADKYTEQGKWMDGWESRRKRGPGFDWCIVKLGIPGVIRGLTVDTSFFTGNFPEYCSMEVCDLEGDPSEQELKGAGWRTIQSKARLMGGSLNHFAVSGEFRATHLRLNIFPDGGVARLRVYGEVKPNPSQWSGKLIDVAAALHGGSVVTCNDSFFGPKDNLILPGRAQNMGEGWETRRRRGPGSDWIIVQLAAPTKITRIEVDTNHFKGNFPESCSIDGIDLAGQTLLPADFRDRKDLVWIEFLAKTKLQAHHQHFYEAELGVGGKIFTHVRLNIYPDGGISRFRVYGYVST